MLAAFLLAMVAQEAGPSREERVLELLRVLEHDEGSWRYLEAGFTLQAGECARPQLLPGYVLFCATMSQGIDDARFRRLGLEILRIYDLAPVVDLAWADRRVMAVLDGLDPERKIGFELRGKGAPERSELTFPDDDSIPEPDAEALDDAEVERMLAAGFRLYVADRQRYSDDEDGFTPALAFLAGLVRFLNEVTDGEDVELGGLLFEHEATWMWKLEPAEGMRLEKGSYGPELVVERAGTVTIPCLGTPDFGSPRPRLETLFDPQFGPELPPSTRGAPSVVVVKSSVRPLEKGHARPEFRARYRQRLGAAELVHETRSFVAFLPRAFDLAQPFELELDLTPGRYSFYGGHARIGAAAPRR